MADDELKALLSLLVDKVGQVIATQAEHGRILAEHSRLLAEHGHILADHSQKHEQTLKTLADHSKKHDSTNEWMHRVDGDLRELKGQQAIMTQWLQSMDSRFSVLLTPVVPPRTGTGR